LHFELRHLAEPILEQIEKIVKETRKNTRICAPAKYFALFTASEKVKLLVH